MSESMVEKQDQMHPQIQNERSKPEQADTSEDVKTFKGGFCRLTLQPYSLTCQITFQKQQNSDEPSNFEQLFPEKAEKAETVKISIPSRWIPASLKKVFPTLDELYAFLSESIGNEQKVSIQKDDIKLIKEAGKEVTVSFADLIDFQKARKIINVDLTNIQDRLLQFSQREWSILDFVSQLYLPKSQDSEQEVPITAESKQNHKENLPAEENEELDDYCELMESYAPYIKEQDQEKFLEECGAYEGDFDQEFRDNLAVEEKNIQQFDKKFQEVIKKYKESHQIQYAAKGRASLSKQENRPQSASRMSSSPFPAGYTPPHLIRETDQNGIASKDQIRIGATNSMKEKLKTAKQMIKMGYSGEEVIQYFEQVRRDQKSGKVKKGTPVMAPSQGPVRPFHIPRNPRAEVPQQQVSSVKVVKEKLMQLLRSRKYNNLGDIKKHMQGEGIIATDQMLKKMVDEIRAKNAQRKKALQQTQENQ